MTLEKEFFEAFGIGPKYQDRCALEDRCKEQGLPWSEVEKRCPHKMNCTDDCVDAYDFAVYPPITPEIVLGLEEIIANQYAGFYYFKTPTHIPGTNNYDYDNLIWNFSSDAASSNKYEFITDSKEKTRQDALLNFCIEYPNELQTEVRGLFKCTTNRMELLNE